MLPSNKKGFNIKGDKLNELFTAKHYIGKIGDFAQKSSEESREKQYKRMHDE